MAQVDFISSLHKATKRDYLARVLEADKTECATISKKFGQEYFDGDRKYGYGGFRYDGRWKSFAEKLIKHYDLKPGQRVLDIGCAKGFVLHEFKAMMPGLEVDGLDVSDYAIANAMDSVKPFLRVGNAMDLPYPDNHFDLVLCVNTLHNLYLPGLFKALREIMRVGRGGKFICMDSYRNEREKVNLMYWQLTCECLFTPAEWEWIFQQTGYDGDWDFVCFE
jgi:protein-L-isoaspartate(D-aspartate) O-methyltransferase